jgi:hypothetical protein
MCKQLQSDKLDDEKENAAEILFKLGKYFEERDGSMNDAIQCYNDALQRNNQHIPALVSIARV